MRNRLWIIDSPLKPTSNDIFFGPWCFENPKDYNLSEISEYLSLNDIRSLENNANDIIEYLLDFFLLNLKPNNSKKFSKKYLKIVLNPWINAFVHLIILRIDSLKNIIKNHKNKEFDVVLMKDDINWEFEDTLDFIRNGSMNKIFNFWIISRIIEKLKPDNWNVEYISKKNKYNKIERDLSFKEKIYNYLIELIPFYSVKGLGLKNSIFLQCKLYFKKNKNFSVENLAKKESQLKLNSEFDWEIYAKKLLPNCFKKINLRNKSRKENGYIICCGSNMYYNEKLKQKIAEKVELGNSLILSQHGGVYGSVAVHAAVNSVEYSNSLQYISWGWKKNRYTDNVVPLPSPYLSKFNFSNQNNNIIFIESNVNPYSFRINSINLSSENVDRQNNLFRIYNSLDKKLKKYFKYRPPLSQSGGGALSLEFERKFKEKIDIIKGDLHIETMKSKIILIDGPGTTMNILFSAKIPTIAFWNYDCNFFDENILEIIEELKGHGIIQNSAENAVKKLNEIYDSIEFWWNDRNLQVSLEKFNKNYALKDSNFFKQWSNFVSNLD